MNEDQAPNTKRQWEPIWEDMACWTWEGEPSEDSVRADVGFIEQAMGLKGGDKVLDLGGGLAHHSMELARRGYAPTELEYSQPFLEEARRRVAQAGLEVSLIRGDMTKLDYDQDFDAVILWGNTFGMFSDEENRRVLMGIRRALKPGGKALIDTQNYYTLPEKLQGGWEFHRSDPELLVLTQGTRDVLAGRFGFDVVMIHLKTGYRRVLSYSWRLYLVPELKRIVADAGLRLRGIYGDDPGVADWKHWKRGQPCPYAVEAFTEKAAKRILLCQA